MQTCTHLCVTGPGDALLAAKNDSAPGVGYTTVLGGGGGIAQLYTDQPAKAVHCRNYAIKQDKVKTC